MDVWKYCEKIIDMKKAMCTICKKESAYLGEITNLQTLKHTLHYCSEQGSESKNSMMLDGFLRPVKCKDAHIRM